MKKIIALLLILTSLCALVFSLGSCAPTDETEIRIGYMAGPTGIGMAKLIHDTKDTDSNLTFKKYADTTSANNDLMNGNLDIACLPTNEAAKYFNSVNSDMQVLAINCLNSLSLLSNGQNSVDSIEDLNGKTIYTCKNGTPKLILAKLLEAYNIDATISHQIGEGDTALTLNTPQDLPPVIVGNKADLIFAPEPMVSNALSKPVAKHEVVLDISGLWNEKFDTPIAMGCIVVSKSFAKEHPVAIENFLKEYKASIDYMADKENNETAAEYVLEATIMTELAPAKSALLNLGSAISFVEGAEMKSTLVEIYKIFGMNVIGGKLPEDSFYYAK